MTPKAPDAKCVNCPYRRYPFVPSAGPRKQSKLIVIGEAPGVTEAAQGKPFAGQSGALLDQLLKACGSSRQDVHTMNVVACRPPGNEKPVPEAVECCSGRVLYELMDLPKTVPVAALGDTAAEFFAKSGTSMTAKQGQWTKSTTGHDVLMSWHPAYVLRRPSALPQLGKDLATALNGKRPSLFAEAPKVVTVTSVTQFLDLLSQIPRKAVVAFDIETNNVNWYDRPGQPADEVIMLVMAWERNWGIAIPATLLERDVVRQKLNHLWAPGNDFTWVAHNGKFDAVFLKSHYDLDCRIDLDTMLAHYTLQETGMHGLKALATQYFGVDDYETRIISKYLNNRNDDYRKIPFDAFALYAVWDVVLTRELALVFEDELRKQGLYEKPFKSVIMPLQAALTKVELRGMLVDINYLAKQGDQFLYDIEVLKGQLQELAGDPNLNPNSPKQLQVVLYDKLGIQPPVGRKVPHRTTGKHLLEQREGIQIVNVLKEYRRVAKIHSSYVKNLIGYAGIDGRVHPTFKIHGTETGRLAVSEPALQTIPRAADKYGKIIRSAFMAPPDQTFVMVDYSQAELRVAAALSGEQFLIDIYANGRDLHTEVAQAMFGPSFTKEHRAWCKMFNFSYLYGGNEHSFAGTTGLKIAVAREFVRRYDATMPRLAAWKQEQIQLALNRGYIETIFGRRRRFPLITPDVLDEVQKAAVNMPVQSVASDFTSLSAVRLVNEGYNVVLLVHDSIMLEAPLDHAEEIGEYVVQVMEETARTHLPNVKWVADAEYGQTWVERPEISSLTIIGG